MCATRNINSELWTQIYNLELELNEKLIELNPNPEISHIYNPIQYAKDIHCAYLEKYLNGGKKLLFIGMNPGPNGMVQTGVPFGNINTVVNLMGLSGNVNQPSHIHPNIPVNGLATTSEEPSGKHLWTLLNELSNGNLDIFFNQCFVHNFCQLAFFNSNGNNIAPSELRGLYKKEIQKECLRTTEKILNLIQPDIIVAIGTYVYDSLQASEYCRNKKLLLMAHPSPRSNNYNNWPMIAKKLLIDNDLLKYLRNEVITN